MSSQGTGSDITPEEANDLLHRLITESIKVQAVFVSGARVTAMVAGLLKTAPDGTLCVRERGEVGTPLIGFDPSLASSRKYGDTRAFPGGPAVPGAPVFASALLFILIDGSQLSLFEIAESR